MIRTITLGLALLAGMSTATAGDLNERALIGGALGGAVGAYAGSELEGRNGAILGGAIGAAAGAAIATEGHDRKRSTNPHGHRHKTKRYHQRRYDSGSARSYRGHRSRYYGRYDRSGRRFCPPGHARKGWCY